MGLRGRKVSKVPLEGQDVAGAPEPPAAKKPQPKTRTPKEEVDTTDESIKQGFADLIAQAEKTYGAGSLSTLRGAFAKPVVQEERFSSGSISLDLALGGGYPRGIILEIFGAESSGKTTLALQAIAEFQRRGLGAAFIDAEHALDPEWACKLGVDLTKLLVAQPDSGEAALNLTLDLARSKQVSIIVVDSVAALTPQAELDGNVGDSLPGLQARMMGQALRKLCALAGRNRVLVIFINQVREKIGVKFGSPRTTPGGNALKFFASIRVDIARIGSLKHGDEPYANSTKAKVVKNKTAPPFRVGLFEISFGTRPGMGTGVAWTAEIVNLGVASGALTKAGAWYKYEGQSVAMGLQAACVWVSENPDIAAKLREHIMLHGESPVEAD